MLNAGLSAAWVLRLVGLAIALTALAATCVELHAWWRLRTQIAVNPQLLAPLYAGRAPNSLWEDIRLPTYQSGVGVQRDASPNNDAAPQVVWRKAGELTARDWALETTAAHLRTRPLVLVFGGLSTSQLVSDLGNLPYDLVAVSAANWPLEKMALAVQSWVAEVEPDAVVLNVGPADLQHGALLGAQTRLLLMEELGGAPPPDWLGRSTFPCPSWWCPQRTVVPRTAYLDSLAVDGLENGLWTIGRVVEGSGAKLVLALDVGPNDATCDADWLAAVLSLQAPLLHGRKHFDALWQQLIDRIRQVSTRTGWQLVWMRGSCGLAGGDVPLPTSTLPGLRANFRSELLAKLPPTRHRPTPAWATPLPAVPLPITQTPTIQSGECVQGGCPEGMCWISGGKLLSGYEEPEVRKMMLDLTSAHGLASQDWFDDDGPRVWATVSAFCIDRLERTTAEAQSCAAAGRCPPYALPSSDPVLPAVVPTAIDAEALCAFAGARLPTDLEWELAARGQEGRTQTWGATPWSGKEGNYCGRECAFGSASSPTDESVGLSAGGRYPLGTSLFGLADMAGNAWEWVADCFVTKRTQLLASTRTADVVTVTPEVRACRRVLRGGSYLSHPALLERRAVDAFPEVRVETRGVRCVRDFGTHLKPLAGSP